MGSHVGGGREGWACMGGVVCLRWVGTGLSETQEKTIEPLITLIRMIALKVGTGGRWGVFPSCDRLAISRFVPKLSSI